MESMTPFFPWLAVLAGYLIGSLSFAVIVSRAMGLSDPRTFGSKNPGATNVLRSGNKSAAVITLLLDAAKGWLAVFLIAKWVADWFHPTASEHAHEWFHLCAGIAAILGHNY